MLKASFPEIGRWTLEPPVADEGNTLFRLNFNPLQEGFRSGIGDGEFGSEPDLGVPS